jgi:D-sedoheptulose 7-phosphate isomerase
MSIEFGSLRQDIKTFAATYIGQFQSLLGGIDFDAVAGVSDRLSAARDARATIFLAGNGGSAATASHWANDLGKATRAPGRPPIRVLSLSDNVSWFTALANDEGYEHVFSGQLDNLAAPGDVLIVISASGNSPNLVNAVTLARERDLTTIGLLGFDGGALKPLVDQCVWIPTETGAYGPVESAHLMVCHLVTASLLIPSHVSAAATS